MTSREQIRSAKFWLILLGGVAVIASFLAGFWLPVMWWSPALLSTCAVLVMLMFLLGITTRLMTWMPGRIAYYLMMIAMVFALGQSFSTEFATQQPTIWSRIAMMLIPLTSLAIIVRCYRQKRTTAAADQPA